MRDRALATFVAAFLSGTAGADTVTDLNPITVTATRTEHSEADAPASITVITADEIRAKGATNLMEAVRGAPGITLTGRQLGGRKNITIRGAEDRHTLVLIDGRRISSTDDYIGHSDYQYGWVSMDQVERIEVVRGPMSALYGSEAVGGVINIITKKAGTEWHGGASVRGDMASGAGGDGHQVSTSIRGPVGGGLSIGVSAEDLRQSAVPLSGDGRYSELEGRERVGGGLDLSYKPVEEHELFVNLLRTRELRWRNNIYRDEYDLHRSQKTIGYRGKWDEVRPEIRFTRAEFDVTNARTNGASPTRPQSMRDDVTDGNLTFPVGSRNLFVVGGEYRTERLENAGLRTGSDDAIHKGVFVQDEIQLMDALALTLGVRRDTHDMFGTEYSPRAYLVWKATPALSLKTGYGEAFRAPTLKQISPNYVGAEGPHTFSGNANIKPETSRSFEIGADWRQGGAAYTATVFRNDIDDLITTRLIGTQGARRFYQYDNVSRARIDGVELSGRQDLGGGFAVAASAMYTDATNRDTKATLEGRPVVTFNPSLEWAGGPWTAAVSVEYNGTQRLEGTSGAQETAPDYTLWNLSGSYRLNDNATLRSGLRNITDVRLAEESPLFGYSELGRSVYFAVDVSF